MNQFSRGFRSPNQPSSFEEKYLLFKCWFWSRNFSNVQEIWNPKDFLTIESIQLVLPIQWMMIFTWSMNDIQSIAEKESELRPLCIEDPPALCSTLDEGFWNKCLSRSRRHRLKTSTKWYVISNITTNITTINNSNYYNHLYLGWPVAETENPVSPLASSPASPGCRCRSAESCK